MNWRRYSDVLRSDEASGTGGAPASAPVAPIVEVPKVETPPAAAEPAKAEPAPSEAKPEPTLLEAAAGKDAKAPEPKEPAPAEAKTEEAKAEPVKVEGEPEKKDAGADEPPPPAPKQYDATAWKLPEGASLDPEKMKAFETLVGTAQMPQEAAQSLLDQHLAEIARVQKDATDNQHKAWKELNDKWKDDFRKDPDLGGNREATTLGIAKAVIETHGGTKAQQAEIFAHLNRNGMGNFPPFIRLMHNIGKQMGVMEDGIVGAAPPTPSASDRGAKWYGNSNGKGAG